MVDMIKHVGKISNTGSRVVVIFREVPNEPTSCLVVESDRLPDIYHQNLMTVVNSKEAQDTVDLADVLNRRSFGSGEPMLQTLHGKGYLKKVDVKTVVMFPVPNHPVPLELINEQIRAAKGEVKQETSAVAEKAAVNSVDDPKVLIEKAKKLEEEAATLRERAYMLDSSLRPTRGRPGLSEADKEARRQDRNRRRRETYKTQKTAHSAALQQA